MFAWRNVAHTPACADIFQRPDLGKLFLDDGNDSASQRKRNLLDYSITEA